MYKPQRIMKKLERLDSKLFSQLESLQDNFLHNIFGGTVTKTTYKSGDKCCPDTWDTDTSKSKKTNGETGDLTKETCSPIIDTSVNTSTIDIAINILIEDAGLELI